MTTKPILFSSPMVRAILEGRKTVTRRPVKPRRDWEIGESKDGSPWPYFRPYVYAEPEPIEVPSPYSVGDLLWVRETWAAADMMYQNHELDVPRVIAYRADHSAIDQGLSRQVPIPDWDTASWNWDAFRWRPSIHMPRWASRITLEVTSVTVERVQDINDEDAIAEGAESIGHFCDLWDSLYGDDSPYSLGRNPWVWRVAFRRVQP